MGCICSKGVRTNDDYIETCKKQSRNHENLDSDKTSVNGRNEATFRLIPNGNKNVLSDDDEEKESFVSQKEATVKLLETNVGPLQPRMSRIGNGDRTAKVVAGWPSWLVSVAGEALNGWLPLSADSFEKLEMIGQGTYSNVYRARDLQTNQIVALKKVRFANMDPESVRFMAREIIILRRLNHPNVMKLQGIIISKASGSMYLVFEYMDHDLTGLASTPGIKFSQSQIKCYVKQLLLGLEHCHSCGVLHRDIKGSNLLLDRDNNLKIADFGLSTFRQRKQPLTSRVVTLWYRPPELLLGSTDYGVTVDLWSTGCILAELFTGKPLLPGRTEVEQMHKIFKLCGSPSEEYWRRSRLRHAAIFKPQHQYKRCLADTCKDLIPPSALALLEVLLAVEPESRGTTSSALQSEFFTTRPFPSEPSSLPRYHQPRKEFDIKLREEEARRRKGASNKQNEAKRFSRESKAVPAPSANAELLASIQKRLGETNQTSVSEKFNPEGDSGFGFRIEPLEGITTAPNLNGSSQLRTQRSYVQRGGAQLSRFSNSVAPNRDGSQFGSVRDALVNQRCLEDGSGNCNLSQRLLEKPNGLKKEDDSSSSSKESIPGYGGGKRERIHYSGPLIPGEGNLDEMLKEHERQILLAVRRAQSDKAKRDDNIQGRRASLMGSSDELLTAFLLSLFLCCWSMFLFDFTVCNSLSRATQDSSQIVRSNCQ
ncbi:probable serine/threonine-protein kinase At1g09600 isoform X2 [Brassica rapa]|uniref:probable serine/threonine-protein kinase At1g09600 isoform X2 n=1 Tax=Brassica campestris TaxID=3711 RepID=UPI000871D0CF|nr:probable serine/threonine-protein kinase At1g09600 isoform X2 [Brassica rapa]